MSDDRQDSVDEGRAADGQPQSLSKRLEELGYRSSRGTRRSDRRLKGAEKAAKRPPASPAGQMVIGSRVPMPEFAAEQQVFSSARSGQRGRFSTGAAVFFVCALAAGTTASVAYFLDEPRYAEGSDEAKFLVRADETPDGENGPDARIDLASLSPANSVTGLEIRNDAEPAAPRIMQSAGRELVAQDVSAAQGSSAVPLNVSVNHKASDRYAFLMFRGMPDKTSFSKGFRLNESWAVSLQDLAGLQLKPPPDFEGEFEMEVLLVKGRDTAVEKASMTVNFASAQLETAGGEGAEIKTAASASAASPTPPPQILASAPAIRAEEVRPPIGNVVTDPMPEKTVPVVTISRDAEREMLERAVGLLTEGDIASARLILEHLAKRGSGRGALALGQTYDPTFFRTVFTIGGPRPDEEKARKWYRNAIQLGQEGAQERLDVLSKQLR